MNLSRAYSYTLITFTLKIDSQPYTTIHNPLSVPLRGLLQYLHWFWVPPIQLNTTPSVTWYPTTVGLGHYHVWDMKNAASGASNSCNR